MTLIYVHGFNSSELSYKSKLIKQAIDESGQSIEFICPRLNWQPKIAIHQVEELIEKKVTDGEGVALAGSSLGGFYSLYLSEKYNLKAALINPAIEAPDLLQNFLGPQTNPYTSEQYVLTQEHMQELRNIDVREPTGKNIWLMLQEGDEVLDYRIALKRFKHVDRLTHEEAGDHSFVGFERFTRDILDFVS